jgi:hypothetical protein
MKRFRGGQGSAGRHDEGGNQPDPEPDDELMLLMALEEAERVEASGGRPVEEDPELRNLLAQEEFERSISGPQPVEADPELLELLRLEEEERRQQD